MAYYNLTLKGGILLTAKGYIKVHAYESNARIPLANVAITVTASDGTGIAMRITNRNGLITPIEIPVPDKSAGQTPDTGEIPYTTVNLYARLKGYEQIEIEDLQVFPGIYTNQNLELIPLSELPAEWDKEEQFITPPQNL